MLDTMLPFHYRKFLPSLDLAEYVTYYDIVDYHQPVSKEFLVFPPSGAPNLQVFFNNPPTLVEPTGEEVLLPKNVVVGQTIRDIEVYHYGAGGLCIHFKPNKLYDLLRENMQRFTHENYNFVDILGSSSHELSEKISFADDYQEMVRHAEDYLRKQVSKIQPRHSYLVGNAISLIDQQPERSIDDVCRELRVSNRHLRRVFQEQVGLGPKYYLRIKRLHRAIELAFSAELVDFQQIIQQCGYYDQSHFGRDVKLFTGKKPLDFFQKEVSFLSIKSAKDFDELYKLEV